MLARRKNSRRDFEATALPHLDVMYGVAYRLTRNRGDAEDLVQDALVRAYRFWHTFEQDSNCKAWLLKILTNTFLNRYQKQKREREIVSEAAREQDAVDGVLMHEHSLAQRDPEDALIGRMLSDDVARALEQLPPEFRVPVVLCDLEGMPYKEIAEVMECPIGTVMSRLYRGRRQLQKELYEYAVRAGIVKPPAHDSKPDNMVDLSTYRRQP
jgi:RNA polymerase sigma-70 factor (ECF subfamily)